RTVSVLNEPLAAELAAWLRDQVDHLGLPEELFPAGDAEPPPSAPIDEAPRRRVDSIRRPRRELPHSPAILLRDETDKSDPDLTLSAEPSDEVGDESGDIMLSVASTRRQVNKLPQVWGDVPPRNPNFTGRDALLQQLHTDLHAARETAVLPQ